MSILGSGVSTFVRKMAHSAAGLGAGAATEKAEAQTATLGNILRAWGRPCAMRAAAFAAAHAVNARCRPLRAIGVREQMLSTSRLNVANISVPF